MALALALQSYGNIAGKGDIHAALELCKLIADIEEEPRSDCYWMLIFRKDTPRDLQNACVMALQAKFIHTFGYIARNPGTGHPHGSNMLWVSAMAEAAGQYRDSRRDKKKFQFNGVLTFESDVVPLRRDWITALTQEWNSRVISAGEWGEEEADPEIGRTTGYPKIECMGHREVDHINGNMIIRPDYFDRHRLNFISNLGWDMCMASELLKVGIDTNLILQHYRRLTISRYEIPFLIKNGITPALYHGVQDKVGRDARKFVREILVDGVTV